MFPTVWKTIYRGSIKVLGIGLSAIAVSLLAGCGAKSMTSYEVEKAKIRNALSKDVECVEPSTGGRMECRSPGESFQLVLWSDMAEGRARVEIILQLWENRSDVGPAAYEFRHVLDAYGFDGPDVGRCLDEQSHFEQFPDYRVSCQINSMSGAGVEANINQTKAV